MYRACIFDLDGTLTDTLESLTFSVNETMRELGLGEITADQCRRFVGNGARVLIEKTLQACEGGDPSMFDRAFAAYTRIFDKNCTYRVKPYPGITDMLEQMRRAGLRLAVLSNKPDRQTVHVVETIFGRDLFDLVCGQRDGIPRKPDPAAALTIAEKLGVSPGEILYVGDSEVDGALGKAAGMDTVLVSWGFRTREQLEESEPMRIVDLPEEILRLIREQEGIR